MPKEEDFDSLPKDTQPAIRVLAMPADTNSAGDIFGGWLMSQVDIAGAVLAHRIASGRVATVAVNNFQFIKPVFVGDLVSIFTELNHIGHTSLEISVIAYAERKRREEECSRVASATITYVALDENRLPRTVKK
ncbi:acyl-CoA thioesterase [Beggiatoa alba]|nr:acyl-CoA thioesterase [Beggiatoa alba]